MITDSTVTSVADAFVESLTGRDDLSPTLESLLVTYVDRREAGDERSAFIHARAVVRHATREGHEAPEAKTGAGSRTAKELEREIASRNEGRAEDDMIRPASRRKADLELALAADDA